MAFASSLEHAMELSVLTQNQVRSVTDLAADVTQALFYIGSKIRIMRKSYARKTREDEARELLATVVLAHIPVSGVFQPSCKYF